MLRRIADNHHIKRNEIIGQRERCANRLAAILGRIGTRPYGTEPHSVSRKQKILRCCRRILNPEVASAAFNRLIHIAADNDSERSLEQHLRIRISACKTVEHAALINNHEVPRLLVHSRRCSHSRTQHLLHLLLLYWTRLIVAYAGTRSNIVEHYLLLRLRLDAVLHTRHQAHTKHNDGNGEHHVQHY